MNAVSKKWRPAEAGFRIKYLSKKEGVKMLFHVYGGNGIYQWIAMLAVLAGLILLNEFARRTKFGGLMMFGIIDVYKRQTIHSSHFSATQYFRYRELQKFS